MSDQQEEKESKGKFKTSISINGYLKERLDEEIELGTFVSNSDAISTALSKMFGHLDERREIKKSRKISDTVKAFEEILKTDEGKKAVEALLNKERGGEKPERIVYNPQKEKEECLNAICPEPRELTPEEARKAAEAKEYYKKLLGEEETVSDKTRRRTSF